MADEKVLGHARFKDGKLIMPSKQKNTTFRNNYNSYKQKFSRNNTRFYSSYQQNKSSSSPEDKEESLDLRKWRQENQDEWLKLRQKAEEKLKQK